ncbi:unnamed protein product [Heterosigma akashiwo]
MAGQAAKKAAKAKERKSAFLLPIFVGIHLLFICVRVLWKWSSFTKWYILGWIITSWASWLGYQGVLEQAANNFSGQLGTSKRNNSGMGSYYFDLLAVSLATLCIALFTDYAWYLMWVVPLFAGFKLSSWLFSWYQTRKAKRAQSAPAPMTDKERAKLEKAQLKKEKRAQQGPKMRYSKR